MSQIFNEIELKHVQSNTFNLSHDKKLTLDMGYLVPVTVLDVIPGDSFNLSTSQMIRFSPLVAPLMHEVNVYMHYFFVPNRLLWPNWSKFITGGEDGLDESVMPFMQLGKAELTNGSLPDYLGLPTAAVTSTKTFSPQALPFAAYQLIYNEYYRDQNLITSDWEELADGNNDAKKLILTTLRKRAWEHDYFTSALPWTQKGIEATIPLGTRANLVYEPIIDGLVGETKLRIPGDPVTSNTVAGNIKAQTGSPVNIANALGDTLNVDVTEHTQVDLTQAAAASINDLRRAFRLQEWLERNARGGSRYTESILAHFGVKSSDARIQRPEYLGGTKSHVTFSEVLQTSGTPIQDPYTTTPQGNMAGHGINVSGGKNIRYYSEEHGYIIGIMSVMPRTSYQQGVPKHFLKKDKFDFYWPSFANLGEQPIENQELYLNLVDTAANSNTFGYTPRYAEYKYMSSSVHGEFRGSLDFWHLGRIFSGPPALNKQFIEANPDKRIFAVTDNNPNQLYAHVFNQVRATRKMPVFGTPTI